MKAFLNQKNFISIGAFLSTTLTLLFILSIPKDSYAIDNCPSDCTHLAGDTMTGNLVMSGSAANIGLGSNWLSGDGTDEGIFVDSTGHVGIGTYTPERLLNALVYTAYTNCADYPERLSHETSGTASTNFGVGIEFELESGGYWNRVSSTVESIWTDATGN